MDIMERKNNYAEELNTSLLDAAADCNLELVKQCVEAGADINVSNEGFEQTPLILASYEGNYEIVCYLIGLKGDGNIPLCSINAVDEHGYSALHMACMNNQKDCAILLLENNADPTLKVKETEYWIDGCGKTPEYFAIRNGWDYNEMIVQALSKSIFQLDITFMCILNEYEEDREMGEEVVERLFLPQLKKNVYNFDVFFTETVIVFLYEK